jgi:hypothetical protein
VEALAGRIYGENTMAWRPYQQLIEGELDNTQLGKVTGWLRFHGLSEVVRMNLEGDFHRDIRGAKIRLRQQGKPEAIDKANAYMQGFAINQTGKVGDITAGLPPVDYVAYPYIEWYSDRNGRVVLELESEQLEVVGTPIPWTETERLDPHQQMQNMANFMTNLARAFNSPRRDTEH